MFNIKIAFIVLVFTGVLFAEDSRGIDGEIVAETRNALTITYKFEIKPVSGKTTWCENDGWYIVTNGTTEDLETTGNICWDNDYVFDVCGGGDNPVFKRTLNEFTIYKLVGVDTWDEKISFYIDYRDCRYGEGVGSNDIAIMVNGKNDKVYYAPGEGPSNCDTTYFTEITEGVTLKIWEVNDYTGFRDISCMCPTPSLTSITNYNNHPKVSWSHDDDPNGSYDYEIWRLLTQLTKPFGTWYLINTVTDIEEYVDPDCKSSKTLGQNSF